jgi:hypothetical protein
MMFVLRSHQPDTEPMPQSGGRLYAITPETENFALRRAGASEVRGRCGLPPEAVSNCGSNIARTSTMQATPSRNMTMLPLFAAAFAVRFGGAAAEVECPKHIADAQALIDRVSANMESDEDRMPHDIVGLVYDLLEDARMLLVAAMRNHEDPQGPYDHARAFAKADAALGYARAAEILLARHRPIG